MNKHKFILKKPKHLPVDREYVLPKFNPLWSQSASEIEAKIRMFTTLYLTYNVNGNRLMVDVYAENQHHTERVQTLGMMLRKYPFTKTEEKIICRSALIAADIK